MKRPVLGILTTYPDGTSCRRPRWPQWRPFAQLMQMGQQAGVTVYIFSPSHIDWSNRRIFGFYRGQRGPSPRWQMRSFPFPDVVYNRVPTRIAEQHPPVGNTLRKLQTALGGNVYNPHYLNKAMVARALRTDPGVDAHLPDTALFRNSANLQRFLNRHGQVYLKAVGGSLGNDIMRLTRGRTHLLLRYNAGARRTRTARHNSWGSLIEQVSRLAGGRPFVMQQAIRLAKVEDRPFDLRILVQKDPAERWIFTGGAARVAGAGQITTHVPRGGRRMTMNGALEEAFGENAAELTGAVEQLATDAAATLEKALGRRFIEISLDVGVDVTGHPWIFELNAKPLHFDETIIQRRRNANLLAYVKGVAEGEVSAS